LGDSGPKNKILLIGLDGAEWDLIDPLIEKGHLPNIQALKQGGSYGKIESLELMLSPIIWTSIATGKEPEKHGITWFMVDSQKAGQRIPVTSTTRKCKAIWNILTERDLRVGVVGWWATYPAEEVNGFMVTDHMAYHTFGVSGRTIKATFGKTHPRLLLDEVDPLIPDPNEIPYEQVKRFIHIDEETYKSSGDKDLKVNFMNPISHFRQILATMEGYRAIGNKLYEEEAPDLMAVYFEGVDSSKHLFMHCMPPKLSWTQQQEYDRYMDVVPEMYKKADEVIGELLAKRDEHTTVILVSDHGFEVGEERVQRKSGTEVATAHLQHKRDGVLILNGPPIIPGKEIFGSSVLDITPMALYLLGLPVGKDMDGRVLDDAIDRNYLAKHPVEFIDTYEGEGGSRREGPEEELDASMEEEMVARLEALGYIGGGDSGGDGIPAAIDGNMARILESKGKLEEAAAEYEKALAKEPTASDTHYELSRIYTQLGRYTEALDHLQTAVKLVPGNLDYRIALGNLFENQGRVQEALGVYNAILAATPENPTALSNAGNCLFRLGEGEKAKEFFTKVTELAPGFGPAWFNLGVYHEQKGDLEAAISHYNKAIGADKKNVLAYVNLGNCYEKAGDLEEAMRSYHEALAIDKDHVAAYFNIGLINSRLGKHEAAAENFWKAVSLDPDLVPGHREFYFANVRLNRPEKAKQALEAWSRLEPANPEVWFQKARFQYAHANPEEGLASLQKALHFGGRPIMEKSLQDPVLTAPATRIRQAVLAQQAKSASAEVVAGTK
jgi:tetratricopeptide (TPR) repeat protein